MMSWQLRFGVQGLVELLSTACTDVIEGAGSAILNDRFWLLKYAPGSATQIFIDVAPKGTWVELVVLTANKALVAG